MKKNIWDKMSFYTNGTVDIVGFTHIQHKYHNLYIEYIKKIPNKHPTSEDEASLVSHLLGDFYDELLIYKNLLSILICTCIESLVNSAGIHVMSKLFYKRTIERNDISTKIRLLIFSIHDVEIEYNNNVLIKIRRLFETRNSLVHPKANHLDFSKMNENDLYKLGTDVFDVKELNVSTLMQDFDDVMDFFYEYNLVPKITRESYKDKKCNELLNQT